MTIARRFCLARAIVCVLLEPCSSFSSSTGAKSANGAPSAEGGSPVSVVPGKRTLSRNQIALDEVPRFPRTWVPLASVAELNPERPTPVSFLDQNYVIYQDSSNNWVVADDACPHRLAPLSEGRIETTESGERLLQCSYHGWTFESSGKCRDIPQMGGDAKTRALDDSRCRLKTYSTILHNSILWTWPWKEDSVQLTLEDATITPEWMLEGVAPAISTYSRDLPYGWDTLIENIIDPAHVPFAHHGIQGTRGDAIPINMTVPSTIKKSGFELYFADRTVGLMREGKAVFKAPFTITYEGEFTADLPLRKFFNLTVVCIPTRPGWSRAIIMSADSRKDDGKEGHPKPKTSLVGKIFRLVPPWVIHLLSNRFLDSDLMFLHRQEQERERRGGDMGANTKDSDLYFTPAQADRAINAFRRWKSTYASVLSPLPPPIQTRAVLFDRYTQHTEHCQHCSKGLDSVIKSRIRTKVVMSLGIVTMAVAQKFFLAGGLVIVVCIGVLFALDFLEDGFKTGNFRHYENN